MTAHVDLIGWRWSDMVYPGILSIAA
jgi:hypothetical protein